MFQVKSVYQSLFSFRVVYLNIINFVGDLIVFRVQVFLSLVTVTCSRFFCKILKNCVKIFLMFEVWLS